MPTVLRTGPYRFYFYAGDRAEPPHVHVERDVEPAKFWLKPVRLQRSRGFKGVELNRLRKLVEKYQEDFLGALNEYFEG